jgi:hypothetical protein
MYSVLGKYWVLYIRGVKIFLNNPSKHVQCFIISVKHPNSFQLVSSPYPGTIGCPDVVLLVSLGWVRLSPLSTSATNRPIVPTPDDGWWWMSSTRGNETWQGKPKYSEKTCTNAALSTINSAWTDLGSNPGRRGRKPPLWHGVCPEIRHDRLFVAVFCFILYRISCDCSQGQGQCFEIWSGHL